MSQSHTGIRPIPTLSAIGILLTLMHSLSPYIYLVPVTLFAHAVLAQCGLFPRIQTILPMPVTNNMRLLDSFCSAFDTVSAFGWL